MDNYSKVEDLLKNYNMKKINIENLKQEIEYVKEDTEMKGISYDGVSTSPTNEIKSIVESTVLGNMEKVSYLEHLIKRHQVDLDKLDNALEALEDVERTVVVEKYINAKQWWQVAIVVRFSETHARRIRKQAIKKLSIGIYG